MIYERVNTMNIKSPVSNLHLEKLQSQLWVGSVVENDGFWKLVNTLEPKYSFAFCF